MFHLPIQGYGPKPSKSVCKDISNEVRESLDAPLVEELVLDDKLEKKTVFLTIAKIEFVRPKQQEKPVRKPVKYAEMYSFYHVQSGITGPIDFNDLITTQLDPVKALEMIQHVSAKEVKDAMFSMGNDKSPGPDGYTACFFK
ncbi:hypothetical protein Tco_0279328, partial [Tanacetum coccineum]